MSTRECYRRCVRAANTLGSAGYNHSRKLLSARLKQAFKTGSATPEQQLRTTEFLERAARYKGTEHNVIRNMLTIEAVRYPMNIKRHRHNKLDYDNEQVKNGLEYVMATFNVPGPKEYNEALKQGKLPELPEANRALSDLIKHLNMTQYSDYDALIKGLNETLGLALPMDEPLPEFNQWQS